MIRRAFLASLLAVTTGPARARAFPEPGLQLYTVRTLLEQDYEGTLARIAGLGCREVEFAGLYPSSSPRQTLAMLKRHGLTAPSGHASYDDLSSNPDAALANARELGQHFIVCPSIDEGRREDLDDWKRIAQSFNRIGEQARRAGLSFAYHNHDFEFQPLGGQIPYDVLLAETDPALVHLEIDLYWMTRGRRDPVAYFQNHPARFPLVHLKDMAADGSIAEVGHGTIDFRRILAAAEHAGMIHCFVEHDEPGDPMRSIETSFGYLRGLRG